MLTLKQSNWLRTKRISVEVEEGEISISNGGVLSSQEFKFPLYRLSRNPVFVRKICWSWLVLGVVIGCLSLASYASVIFGDVAAGEAQAGWVTSSCILLLSLVMLAQASKQSFNGLIYKDNESGENVMVIHPSRPTKEVVNNFKLALSNLIAKQHFPPEMEEYHKVEVYKKHLVFLHEGNVLTDEQLSSALAKLDERLKGDKVVELVR